MMDAENNSLKNVIGDDLFTQLNKMNSNSQIKMLLDLVSEKKGNDLSILQLHILKLLKQSSHLDFAKPKATPHTYDNYTTDITQSELDQVGHELNIKSLTHATIAPVFPIKGIMYGYNARVFIPLIVRKHDTSININFLFFCGSPYTYLCTESFKALGLLDTDPSNNNDCTYSSTHRSANVNVHGTTLTVYLSKHSVNVDVLGQDFMIAARAKMSLNYPDRECILSIG